MMALVLPSVLAVTDHRLCYLYDNIEWLVVWQEHMRSFMRFSSFSCCTIVSPENFNHYFLRSRHLGYTTHYGLYSINWQTQERALKEGAVEFARQVVIYDTSYKIDSKMEQQ